MQAALLEGEEEDEEDENDETGDKASKADRGGVGAQDKEGGGSTYSSEVLRLSPLQPSSALLPDCILCDDSRCAVNRRLSRTASRCTGISCRTAST